MKNFLLQLVACCVAVAPVCGAAEFEPEASRFEAEHALDGPPPPMFEVRQRSLLNPSAPKVNVITGEYCDEACDLVVAGAEPLSYRRFYGHQSFRYHLLGHWRVNPECQMHFNFELKKFNKEKVSRLVAVGQENGSSFLLDVPQGNSFTFNPSKYSSFMHSDLSGQRHPLNSTTTFRASGKSKKAYWYYSGLIKDGDGSEREFVTHSDFWPDDDKGSYEAWGPPPYVAKIVKKKLPNGNIIRYEYSDYYGLGKHPESHLLRSIKAYNAKEDVELASFDISYRWNTGPYPIFISQVEVVGSDGRRALFSQGQRKYQSSKGGAQFRRLDVVLDCVEAPGRPRQGYNYQWLKSKEYADNNFLYQALLPGGVALETSYTKDKKVAEQRAPVGLQGQMHPVATYRYGHSHTAVMDAENNQTIYRFDSAKRIVAIEKYMEGALYSVERNTWDAATGNLLGKTFEDSSGTTLSSTSYQYDSNHNTIEERINGEYVLTRTFSDDGFNLLLTESDRPGKITRYTYLPHTNLLTSEIVYDHGKICKRTFHLYDASLNACRVKTIVDDGQSLNSDDLTAVTYRHITEITPKRSHPCLGLAEEIREKTLDDVGDEILLKKVRYTYHPNGNILREEHYDSEEAHRYTLSNTYDDRELLVATTDALGNQTLFEYDDNHNLIAQSGPRTEMRTEWVYDAANRPIEERQWQSEGDPLVTQKRYDKLGRVIEEIDPCGFATSYTYDSLGRITSITYPDGAIERKEYDALGNVTKEIDAGGYETRKNYSPFGQVTDIYYPDGSREHFVYNPTGTCATHTDKNGAETKYIYDIFDHVIQTERLHPTSTTWSPFSKLSETDELGVQTHYTYDLAGRLTSEEKEGRKTRYLYDALGRQYCTQVGDTRTIEEYDLLDRPIEKRVEVAGVIYFQERYAYDASGNKIRVITSEGTTKTRYNAQNKPIRTITPDGHTTNFTYDYSGLYTSTATNPLGLQTIEEHDCRGRLVRRTLKTAAGEILHRTEKTYDPLGNLIASKEEGPKLKEAFSTTWSYGPGGRIESVTEGGQKTTRYLYDACGRLKALSKPDDTQIDYEYDCLGRLSKYGDYCYTYDPKGRVVEVEENGATTTRIYNSHDQIVQEQLASGLIVKNVYDDQGRRTTLILPDASTAHYTYTGPYLHTVSRGSYTYTYAKRNLAGKPVWNILPGGVGTLAITWDSALRWKALDSPHYKARYTYDSLGNLITATVHDPLGDETKVYTYDDLSQLITENGHSYAYDTLYNRTAKDETPYLFTPLYQVAHDGTRRYVYDKNGNLISDGETSYEYDLYDRLVAVTKNGRRTTYTYDPFNRRISKDKELYIWDGKSEIGSMKQGWLQELRILGEGLGAEIGSAVIFELYGYTYFPIHDIQGSLATMIYTRNSPYGTYRYTSFGEPLTRDTYSPWRFAGKRHDAETDLIYFGRRYYCPTLGRWLTPDPQGFDDGPNLYAYVHNNPFTLLDLHGLYSLRNAWGGTKDFFYGAGSHLCGGIQHMGYLAGRMGEWMMADSFYEMGDPSLFRAKSQASFEGWKAFGHTLSENPLRTAGELFAPGVMEAIHNPSSPRAWGKAAVDVAMIGLPAAKLGNATGLGRAGRIGGEFATLGKAESPISRGGTLALGVDNGVLSNRLTHIFGKPEHCLDSLALKFGSQENAFNAVQNASNQALRAGKLSPNVSGILPSGNLGNVINVEGMNVRLIGGRIENGSVVISSFSRKGL